MVTLQYNRETTMDRRDALKLAVLAAAGTMAGQAGAQDDSFIIVTLINAEAGKTQDELLTAVKGMIDVIRKMDGLEESQLLQSAIPNNNPAFVHFMRWKDRAAWEAVFASDEFNKAFEQFSPFFKMSPVEIFTRIM